MAVNDLCKTASIVIFMLCFRTGVSNIVVAPNSKEVQHGGSTYFNCSTSVTAREIHWFHYPVSSTDRSFVYGFGQFYSPYLGRFAMDKNATTGEYNLIIKSVVAEDAGKYECQELEGSGMKKSAQLVILDTSLMCQSNVNVQKVIGPNSCDIEPDQLILTCMVQYHGNEAPILQWILNDNNESITNGITRQINDNSVIYNLTMTSDEITDGSFYVCRTTRSSSKISCNSGSVKVVGPRKGASDGGGNCDSLKSAIICICVLLLLPLSVAVVALTLMLRNNWRPKLPDNICDCFPCIKKTDANSKPTQPAELSLIQHDQPTLNEELAETQDKVAYEKTMEQLRTENEALRAKVNELEQEIYSSDHKSNRTTANLTHTIVTKAAGKDTPISGMAILENNLFVVKKNCPFVEVYDSKTFVFERLFENLRLANPLDIASSKEDKSVYVFNRENSESTSYILKFNIAGKGGKIWPIENDVGRLSTYECNLIVCFCTKRIIVEYSPEGEPMNTVSLSPANGFNKLWHAVKLTGTHFVVSHSNGKEGQRVCVVDINGTALRDFEELPKVFNKAHLPIYLVGHRNESVLVADARNKRVLLLSSKELQYEGVLIETAKNEIPIRLCLNETRDRLFIGVTSGDYSKSETWKEGRILIYNITK